MFLLFLLSLKLTDFEAFVSCSRMMCPQPNCARGQCAMRQGRCCETKCQPIKGLKGGRPGGLVGGSGGSEEVNCCGGGSACGFVHCAAIAPDKKGCVRPWMLPKKSDGTKMTLDDCKAGAKKAKDKGEYNDGQENDGPSRGSISRNTIKLGGRCSTSRTRGNRGRITPCESGYVCKITNKGDMRVDRPNSGLCVAKRGGPPRLSGGLQVDPGFGRVTQRAARMCPNSARQMCKMLCRPKVCPQGQCAMRQGSCCDMTCVGGH